VLASVQDDATQFRLILGRQARSLGFMRPVENELDTLVSVPDSAAAPKPQPVLSRMARLFEEYAPAVRAFLLRRLGNIDDAQEAAQEVFVQLLRQEQKGLLESEARGYLFTVADNWAKDCRRKARSHVLEKHEPLDGQDIEAPEPADEEAIHWRQGLELVIACVQELPIQTQRIFYLYHGSRMSYSDIATELGITARTVERHMAQAITHCRPRLQAYFAMK
jgi:RNA polymerase sigma factor (sigma-70 family)